MSATIIHADNLGTGLVVSATALGGDGEVRGMLRPRVPNYALRRLAVGLVAAVALVFAMMAIVVLLAGFGSTPASASEALPATSSATAATTVHVATSGDTLWSIASTYRGDVSHGRYLDALVRVNGGAAIQVGQAIWLP